MAQRDAAAHLTGTFAVAQQEAGPYGMPSQHVALRRSQIKVQEPIGRALIDEAAEHIYHAAMMDPHTAAEPDLRQIRSRVAERLTAHAGWLPDWCRPARAA